MYDSAIFAAYEFCYFLDHTGNPLAYSASLAARRAELCCK
jgi:hypothetical protein